MVRSIVAEKLKLVKLIKPILSGLKNRPISFPVFKNSSLGTAAIVGYRLLRVFAKSLFALKSSPDV